MWTTREDDGDDLVALLAHLGREYRHLQKEHERERAGGATRSGLAARMRQLEERFERLLAHWVADEALREAWTRYLREGGTQPAEPAMGKPPLFKGLDEAGSRVELRPHADGGWDLVVDGAVEIHEAVPWSLDPDLIEPIRIGRHACREVSDAPAGALEALAAFLATPAAEPPTAWARALLEDGLIDLDFALTVRGFRLLGKTVPPPARRPSRVTYGILAADATRARLFVLAAPDGADAPTTEPLVELAETTHPEQRAREAQLFADTRPGLHREGPHGPRHGVSDRREGHWRDAARRFAAEIVRDATRLWRSHGVNRVILVASPAMLGALRPVLARVSAAPQPWSVRELARDFTRLGAPALHDALVRLGLVPPRRRLPPLRPSPGVPV